MILSKKNQSEIFNICKDVFAILLLLIALRKNPYSYYIFLRWVLMIYFIGHIIWNSKRKYLLYIWIIGLITYNPMFPIHSTREIWTIINIITIAIILFLMFPFLKKLIENKNI